MLFPHRLLFHGDMEAVSSPGLYYYYVGHMPTIIHSVWYRRHAAWSKEGQRAEKNIVRCIIGVEKSINCCCYSKKNEEATLIVA